MSPATPDVRAISIGDTDSGVDLVIEVDKDTGLLVGLHAHVNNHAGTYTLNEMLSGIAGLVVMPTPTTTATLHAIRPGAEDAIEPSEPEGDDEPDVDPAGGDGSGQPAPADPSPPAPDEDEPASVVAIANGRRPRPTDAELKAIFRQLGTPTYAQLGEHFGVPASTAGYWIRTARERGVRI